MQDLNFLTRDQTHTPCSGRGELLVCFWLHWVFVALHRLSLVAVHQLPIVVASLVLEHRL